MKKLTLLTVLVWLIALALLPAQAQQIGKGDKFLNAGIGLGSYTYRGVPIGVAFETGIADNITVGGSFDYARYGYNYGGYKWRYNFLFFGVRGSYHLGELLSVADNKFDPYVGMTIGVRTASYKDNYGYGNEYVSPYNTGAFVGIHIGSRYMFTEKLGGFAEVGYGVAVLKLGITAKL